MRVTRFLTALEPGPADDPIPRPALAALRDLIGADEAEYFEFRRDRAKLAHTQSHDWDEAPGSDEALVTFGYQNPLGWRRWRPADGPRRLTTSISPRALLRLEFYDGLMRPNGLTDLLKIWVHRDEHSVACVQLWNRGGVFDDRQEDMLSVVHQHLARTRAEAIAKVSNRSPRVGLTRREAEVLTWAMRGEADGAIGDRLGMATATVGKHLEHAFAKLGVHSRSEALWRITALQEAASSTKSNA